MYHRLQVLLHDRSGARMIDTAPLSCRMAWHDMRYPVVERVVWYDTVCALSNREQSLNTQITMSSFLYFSCPMSVFFSFRAVRMPMPVPDNPSILLLLVFLYSHYIPPYTLHVRVLFSFFSTVFCRFSYPIHNIIFLIAEASPSHAYI